MDEILSGGCELDVSWVPEIMHYKKYTKCFPRLPFSQLPKCIGNMIWANMCWHTVVCMFFHRCRHKVEFAVTCTNSQQSDWMPLFLLEEKMFPLNSRVIQSSQHLPIIIFLSPAPYLFALPRVPVWIDIKFGHFPLWKPRTTSSRSLFLSCTCNTCCVFVVDLLLVLSKWLSGRTRYTAEVIVSSQINAWFIKPASNYHAAGTALALCLLFHITVSCALFTPFSPIRLPAILMKMKKKSFSGLSAWQTSHTVAPRCRSNNLKWAGSPKPGFKTDLSCK